MSNQTIEFAATNAVEEAKLKKLCETMGEFMDCTIKFETRIVVVAIVPADRKDIVTILNRIAIAQHKPKNNGKEILDK